MIADVDTNNAIDDDNHDVNKPEEHEQRKQNRSKYFNYVFETFTSNKTM